MAQILKDDIRDKILKCATTQFIEAGFLNTKMKDIAVKANISVGNIYRYYNDKESLYENIAKPVMLKINEIFKIMDINERTFESTKIAAMQFIEIYKQHKEVFIMMLENSNNTKFETMKNEIINNFYLNIKKFPDIVKKIEVDNYFTVYARAFACAFINGIISILTEKIDEDEKIKQINRFLESMRYSIVKECM